MITNTYCVFDFETGSRDPSTTQPIQIAAVMVNPLKLEVIEGSEFESMIRPYFTQEECDRHGVAMLEDEALNINKKTREQLADAPTLENVWTNFQQYVKGYQKGKNSNWNAPVPVGFNIAKFDLPILERICKRHGPFDETQNRQKIFHPMYYTDVMQTYIDWFENWNQVTSFSQSALCELVGISTEGAHDALVDVKNCAELFIRFKKLYRNINAESGPKIKWKRQ